MTVRNFEFFIKIENKEELTVSNCFFNVNVSNTIASHSFWNVLRSPGIDAAETGLGWATVLTIFKNKHL